MTWLAFILLLPCALATIGFLFPGAVIKAGAELLRRLLLFVIQWKGRKVNKILEKKVRDYAVKKKIPKEIVEYVLNRKRQEAINFLGRYPAEKILGPPSHWERYF